jgi:hypothetical protein
MSHTLRIEVSEPVYQALEKWAAIEGTTPQALASDWVARRVSELEGDPLMRWAGAIDVGAADVALRHDEYLGRAIAAWNRDELG